jgi:hypothetical protein
MAADANPSLLRQHAAVILARQAAMREVKRRRQKQGSARCCPTPLSLALARSGLPLIRSFTPKHWLRHDTAALARRAALAEHIVQL